MNRNKYKNLIYQTPVGLIVATILTQEMPDLLRRGIVKGYKPEEIKDVFVNMIWCLGTELQELPRHPEGLQQFIDTWFENLLVRYAIQIDRNKF